MLGLVGCTTMRPIAPVFSRPTRFHVIPPSVDLKMPQPGEIVLRESSSPVPAHTCIVSDGAIASSPIDTHFSLSNTGQNVVPALVVLDSSGCRRDEERTRRARNAGDGRNAAHHVR